MHIYRFDGIVFDFDGTLVQSKKIKTWAFGELYKEYGEKIVQQIIIHHKEHEGISRFVKFRYWHEDLLGQSYSKEIGENLSRNYSQLVLEAMVKAPYVEGALEFLKKHYQHIPLFVASGTPETELREIIKLRSMLNFFQGIYGSPATKTEILQTILTKRKLSPEQILMVGDTLIDLEGAQSVGAEFVGIRSGKTSNVFPSTKISLESFSELDKFTHR